MAGEMKCSVVNIAFGLLLAFLAARDAKAGFEYLCIQPGDSVYTTLPAVSWPLGERQLQDEYQAQDLFPMGNGKGILSFRPDPRLEILIEAEDYENEVVFDRVRFLRAEGKLYAWVGFTANKKSGVVRGIIQSLRLDGKEIARSRPLTVDVRQDLAGCN